MVEIITVKVGKYINIPYMEILWGWEHTQIIGPPKGRIRIVLHVTRNRHFQGQSCILYKTAALLLPFLCGHELIASFTTAHESNDTFLPNFRKPKKNK